MFGLTSRIKYTDDNVIQKDDAIHAKNNSYVEMADLSSKVGKGMSQKYALGINNKLNDADVTQTESI